MRSVLARSHGPPLLNQGIFNRRGAESRSSREPHVAARRSAKKDLVDQQRRTDRERVSRFAFRIVGFIENDRFELNRILNLYGRMVADGEWRDYAIDFLRDRAVFSVFRRASEVPIYRIEKDPRLARKQGIYSVISASGLILRRGHELDRVLLVIDRKLAVV